MIVEPEWDVNICAAPWTCPVLMKTQAGQPVVLSRRKGTMGEPLKNVNAWRDISGRIYEPSAWCTNVAFRD